MNSASEHTRAYRLIPMIVALALFMEALDTTIINTAIPVMAHSLNVPAVNLKVALISYLLSLAIFIPVSGWIADRFGARRTFIIALSVFTLGSLWCGFAGNLWELVIARAVQGIGGAMTMPVGRLIIVRLVPRHEFMTAMNRIITPALIGPALGPLAGGVIVEHFSWPWIFWVNIPFGIITLLLAMRYMHELPAHPVEKFDLPGFLLFGSGLAGITFTLALISESNLSLMLVILLLAISLGLLGIYYRRARQQTRPLINFALFRLRTFRVSFLGNLLVRMGFGGMPFLLPLLLQIALGYSAQLSGLLTAFLAIGAIITKTLSQRVVKRWGFRRVLMINTFLLAFAIACYSLIHNHTLLWVIALLTAGFGFLSSMQYSAMSPLAYAEIDATQTAAVASLMATIQQLAASFGVALAAIFLHIYAQGHIAHLSIQAFHYTFLSIAVVMLLALGVFVQLKTDDGKNMYVKQE